MYCMKCGKELPDDAKFCHNCGATIYNPSNTEQQVDDNNKKTVTSELSIRDSIKEVGAGENHFKNRAVSSNDKETNDLLFTMFGKLAVVVKQAEISQKKLERDKAILNNPKVEVVLGIPVIGRIFIFIGFLAFSFCLVLFASIFRFFNSDFSDRQIDILSNFVFIYFAVLMYVLVIKGVDLIRYYKRKKQFNAVMDIARNDLAYHEDLQQRIFEHIEPMLRFVPPDYRTSVALQRFYDDYKNTRVNNLSEAIELLERKKEHNEVLGQFRAINYNVQVMQSQLVALMGSVESLKSDIWGANFWF